MEEEWFFVEVLVPPIFFGHWAKFLAHCRKVFVGVLETAFYVSIEKIWRKIFFRENSNVFHHSRTLSKKHLTPFVENFSSGLSQLHPFMSLQTFGGGIIFCETFSFSYRFRTLSKNFSTFCRKAFLGFVTTAFHMSSGTFGGRIVFVKFLVIPIVSWHSAKYFHPFVGNFSAGLSELRSTCL